MEPDKIEEELIKIFHEVLKEAETTPARNGPSKQGEHVINKGMNQLVKEIANIAVQKLELSKTDGDAFLTKISGCITEKTQNLTSNAKVHFDTDKNYKNINAAMFGVSAYFLKEVVHNYTTCLNQENTESAEKYGLALSKLTEIMNDKQVYVDQEALNKYTSYERKHNSTYKPGTQKSTQHQQYTQGNFKAAKSEYAKFLTDLPTALKTLADSRK